MVEEEEEEETEQLRRINGWPYLNAEMRDGADGVVEDGERAGAAEGRNNCGEIE